jgi:hypothetical protein
MKWSSGTSWIDMGFLTAQWGDMPSVVIDPSDNKPIVAFEDNVNSGRAHVKKWSSGTSWTDLGFPSTGNVKGWYRPPSIALDPSDNKPLVAFGDDDNGGKIHVMKWSYATSWNDLGLVSTGEGHYPTIAVDPSDNKPIVVFVDLANGEMAHVMKWSYATSWNDLGFPSAGVTTGTVIAIDPSDYKPVVAYVDWPGGINSDLGAYIHVKKWSSGTSWTDLGILSQRWSDNPSITIDPSDNKPVVVFRDWENNVGPGNFIHVKKWSEGTSWIGLGYPSEGPSVLSSIAIDPSDNKPVVMYADAWEGDARVYVSKHP